MVKICFKYHPNIWDMDVFSKSVDGEILICQCCEKETEYYLDTMYCKEDIKCICPKCVVSGKAAEQVIFDYEADNPDDYYEDSMEYLGNGIVQGYLFCGRRINLAFNKGGFYE